MKILNKLLRLKLILLGKDNVSIMNQINHHTQDSFNMAPVNQRSQALKMFILVRKAVLKHTSSSQKTLSEMSLELGILGWRG